MEERCHLQTHAPLSVCKPPSGRRRVRGEPSVCPQPPPTHPLEENPSVAVGVASRCRDLALSPPRAGACGGASSGPRPVSVCPVCLTSPIVVPVPTACCAFPPELCPHHHDCEGRGALRLSRPGLPYQPAASMLCPGHGHTQQVVGVQASRAPGTGWRAGPLTAGRPPRAPGKPLALPEACALPSVLELVGRREPTGMGEGRSPCCEQQRHLPHEGPDGLRPLLPQHPHFRAFLTWLLETTNPNN